MLGGFNENIKECSLEPEVVLDLLWLLWLLFWKMLLQMGFPPLHPSMLELGFVAQVVRLLTDTVKQENQTKKIMARDIGFSLFNYSTIHCSHSYI